MSFQNSLFCNLAIINGDANLKYERLSLNEPLSLNLTLDQGDLKGENLLLSLVFDCQQSYNEYHQIQSQPINGEFYEIIGLLFIIIFCITFSAINNNHVFSNIEKLFTKLTISCKEGNKIIVPRRKTLPLLRLYNISSGINNYNIVNSDNGSSNYFDCRVDSSPVVIIPPGCKSPLLSNSNIEGSADSCNTTAAPSLKVSPPPLNVKPLPPKGVKVSQIIEKLENIRVAPKPNGNSLYGTTSSAQNNGISEDFDE